MDFFTKIKKKIVLSDLRKSKVIDTKEVQMNAIRFFLAQNQCTRNCYVKVNDSVIKYVHQSREKHDKYVYINRHGKYYDKGYYKKSDYMWGFPMEAPPTQYICTKGNYEKIVQINCMNGTDMTKSCFYADNNLYICDTLINSVKQKLAEIKVERTDSSLFFSKFNTEGLRLKKTCYHYKKKDNQLFPVSEITEWDTIIPRFHYGGVMPIMEKYNYCYENNQLVRKERLYLYKGETDKGRKIDSSLVITSYLYDAKGLLIKTITEYFKGNKKMSYVTLYIRKKVKNEKYVSSIINKDLIGMYYFESENALFYYFMGIKYSNTYLFR